MMLQSPCTLAGNHTTAPPLYARKQYGRSVFVTGMMEYRRAAVSLWSMALGAFQGYYSSYIYYHLVICIILSCVHTGAASGHGAGLQTRADSALLVGLWGCPGGALASNAGTTWRCEPIIERQTRSARGLLLTMIKLMVLFLGPNESVNRDLDRFLHFQSVTCCPELLVHHCSTSQNI